MEAGLTLWFKEIGASRSAPGWVFAWAEVRKYYARLNDCCYQFRLETRPASHVYAIIECKDRGHNLTTLSSVKRLQNPNPKPPKTLNPKPSRRKPPKALTPSPLGESRSSPKPQAFQEKAKFSSPEISTAAALLRASRHL